MNQQILRNFLSLYFFFLLPMITSFHDMFFILCWFLIVSDLIDCTDIKCILSSIFVKEIIMLNVNFAHISGYVFTVEFLLVVYPRHLFCHLYTYIDKPNTKTIPCPITWKFQTWRIRMPRKLIKCLKWPNWLKS